MDHYDDDLDIYREENPERESQSLAEILDAASAPSHNSLKISQNVCEGSHSNVNNPELIHNPGQKDLQCASCHLWFTGEAQWFGGRWCYPNLCDPSCGGAISQVVIDQCEPAKSRTFYCPKCGIDKSVEPVLAGGNWEYRTQCSHCGYTSVNLYHLQRKCKACGRPVNVSNRNPEGKCHCDGTGPKRPF